MIFLKKFNKILFLILTFGIFFGVSLKLDFPLREEPISKKVDFIKYPAYFDFKSLQKLFAANENQWDGVRDIVKFVRDFTLGINSLMSQFESLGILNQNINFSTTSGGYKIKLVTNNPQSISLTATGTSVEFSHRLILWNATTNQKYLELFFDDASTKTGGDGAVVTFEPYQSVLGGSSYNSAQRMECYTKDNTMICSWDGPILISGTTEKAQLVVIKSDDGTMSINLLDRLNTTTTSTINTNLGVSCQENPNTGAGERYYYTVLAILKLSNPYYTTAAFGVKKDTKSLNLGTCTNIYNHGYFNTNANPNATDSTKYFAAMGPTPPSADYPSTSSVDNLLSLEPTKATVDALSVSFKSSDSAP
ncbi:MAG: hypothetical protein ACK4UJ_00325 [Leptonema sp. (in: bacteria)]